VACWAGQRVCVTGGTGFLGWHLVRQLLALGSRVKVLALPVAADHPLKQLKQVETVFGDIRDTATVRRAVADCDTIIHTAGLVALAGPALRHMQSVHVEGTRAVLAAAAPHARVVHTSSVVTVGASAGSEVLDEDSPFALARLRVDYVHAKRAAEQLALDAAAAGRAVFVVNPSYLVGPEDHERSELGRMCARFWKGQLRLIPPGGFNFVDARDVARGHLLAAEHGQPGRRYILGGENRTLTCFFALLAQVGVAPARRCWPLPHDLLTALGGLAEAGAWLRGKKAYPSLQLARLHRWHWFYRCDRAARELGYRARSLVVSLADTYRWQAERGQLGRLPGPGAARRSA